MKRKLFKSLLAVALICTGSNAWADTVTLYSQDYESATDATSWTSSGVTLSLATDNTKYISAVATGSDRYCYSNFYESSDIYGSYTTYTLTFDAAIVKPNNHESQFVVMADGHKMPGSAGKNYFQLSTSSSYDESANAHLLRIQIPTSGTATIIGDENKTMTVDGSWMTFTLEVTSTKVNYTIIKRDDKQELASGTYTLAEGQSNKAKGLFAFLGRYANNGKIFVDNIKVTTEVDEEVVTTPSISTTYAGANRIVTITGGTSTGDNTVTTYYTTDNTDPTIASNVYTEPLNISSDCTVKAISVSSTNVSSSIASLAITTGIIALATPSISASGFTNESGLYVMNPTFNFVCNNSAIEGTPVATLSYTFTPEGGSESSLVTASSFTPTTKGTLRVIASADNYDSSEKTLVVSNCYAVSFTGRDYTTATNEDNFTTWGDASSVNWTGWASGLTSYLATATITDDYHLGIANANTISLVLGWGWVRGDQKTYGYRIRYATEGDFMALKENSSKGADASAITYQTVFLTSGTGKITDYVTLTVPAAYAVQQLFQYSPTNISEEYYSIKLSEAGWATLFTPCALDIRGTGLTAYTATCDGSTVTLAEVENVPANTGVVLKGVAGSYNVPLAASSSTAKGDLTGNATVATAFDAVDGKTLYVLALNGSGKVQFQPVNEGSIAAGKAYLALTLTPPSSGVKALSVAFGTATGINAVESARQDGMMFNLAGQRVTMPARGLYIKNGKKVVVK